MLLTLGKLYVRERAPWIVTLRGGDAVVPNAELALRRDEAEGGGRAYVVERRPATGETAAVARFHYEPQSDELKFRWLEAAAELAGAGLLRLCLLELNIDGETKTLAFSKPRPAPPLEFDLGRRTENIQIECDQLPDPKLLRLEFTEVEGPIKHYHAQPDGPVEARKPLNVAFQRMDRHKNLQVTAGIQIRFSTSRKGITVTRNNGLVNVQAPLPQPGQQLQARRQQWEEQRKKAEAAMKQAGHRTQSEAIFQTQMAPIEHTLAHLDLIEQVDKQAKIHYRILLDSGSHQVPLFDSRIAEAP